MEVNTNELPKNSEQWASINGYKNYQVSWWGRVRNAKTGRILKGGLSGDGYRTVSLCKNGKAKTHKIHQLVAREWAGNPEEKRCVDHIDGNQVNNHYENLRYATHTENNRNAKKTTKATSSIYKGVYLHKPTNKWMAYFGLNRKVKNLGYYETEREAAESYNAAAIEHYGVYAKLNDMTTV
jgi:hypothetical protein